jgi:hypothetical protein
MKYYELHENDPQPTLDSLDIDQPAVFLRDGEVLHDGWDRAWATIPNRPICFATPNIQQAYAAASQGLRWLTTTCGVPQMALPAELVPGFLVFCECEMQRKNLTLGTLLNLYVASRKKLIYIPVPSLSNLSEFPHWRTDDWNTNTAFVGKLHDKLHWLLGELPHCWRTMYAIERNELHDGT